MAAGLLYAGEKWLWCVEKPGKTAPVPGPARDLTMVMIQINRTLSLPAEEISFTFSRAGGPGGQHVNKVSTRATLWFNVEESPSLTQLQKEKIRSRLASRINRKGELQVVAADHRTQKANREEALQRFISLMSGAFRERKARRKGTIPARARERRLQAKKRRSQLKAARSRRNFQE
jgi:ribosome-associated protein